MKKKNWKLNIEFRLIIKKKTCSSELKITYYRLLLMKNSIFHFSKSTKKIMFVII